MGNPDSGASSPPPQQNWQSTPQPPAQPPAGGGTPAGGGMPSWTSNITAQGTIAGPGGLALADVPNRIIAWIIDGIIVAVVGYIIGAITTSMLGDDIFGGLLGFTAKVPSALSSILAVVLMLALTAAYFIYTWLKMGGASLGMRALKLSVRDATSGGAISQNQAIMRWAFLWAPAAVFWGLWGWGIFGLVAAIGLLVWEIYLLVTTAQSATRQGLHDKQANTVVAKVG